MSSDESGDEGDVCMYSRPLPWLKKKYHSSLKKLDVMWTSGLSVSSKRLLRPRAQGRSSERPIPFDVPDYLLRNITNTSVDNEDI